MLRGPHWSTALTEARPAPRRGDIWVVDFGTPIGHEQGYQRPAVVVSDDRLNRSRAELVIVVPVTTTRRGLPSHVEIGTGESGLAETSFAKGEDVKSISTRRLTRRLGTTTDDRLGRLENVLRLLLAL
jgi:mRNA interferase MazF